MTWFLLLFTWFLAVISDQWQTPFCTAYSVSTCASVYWVKEDWHKIATKELFITTEWYWNRLPQLKRFNISYEYGADVDTISKKLQHWPLIMRVPSWYKIDDYTMWYWHHTCLVGETDTDWIIANSRGTWYWVYGYQRVSKSITNVLTFQDFWSWNLTAQLTWIKSPVITKKPIKWTLTPSLITLTEKKGDSLGSGQMVKSPTINKKNTRKKYLKRLD